MNKTERKGALTVPFRYLFADLRIYVAELPKM